MKKPADFTIASRGPAEGQAPVTAINNNFFMARYYDTETGVVLPFEHMVSRIRKTGEQVKRLSGEMMLDIYFLWTNWEGAYHRQDNFRKWVNESLDISYSYTWDIIKVVDLITEHVKQISKDVSLDLLSGLLENAGMQRLKLVAQIENEEQKIDILNDLCNGKKYSVDDILAINRVNNPPLLTNMDAPELQAFLKDCVTNAKTVHDAEIIPDSEDESPHHPLPLVTQTPKRHLNVIVPVSSDDTFKRGMIITYLGNTAHKGEHFEVHSVDFRNETLEINLNKWQAVKVPMKDCVWFGGN